MAGSHARTNGTSTRSRAYQFVRSARPPRAEIEASASWGE
jgi:hypothetical protein